MGFVRPVFVAVAFLLLDSFGLHPKESPPPGRARWCCPLPYKTEILQQISTQLTESGCVQPSLSHANQLDSDMSRRENIYKVQIGYPFPALASLAAPPTHLTCPRPLRNPWSTRPTRNPTATWIAHQPGAPGGWVTTYYMTAHGFLLFPRTTSIARARPSPDMLLLPVIPLSCSKKGN